MDSWLLKIAPVLNRAMHARDGDTAQHCHRVARMALRLGEVLGLQRHDLFIVAIAARLHDIGKIDLPDTILLKNGPLDQAEWAIMRTHSTRGEALILMQHDIPFRQEIARVVRHHHEHWNGGGYPDGLQGEAIPLLARIVSVTDAYDAMTSSRSYHPGRSHQNAMSILTEQSGGKYDAGVVKAFHKSIRSGSS